MINEDHSCKPAHWITSPQESPLPRENDVCVGTGFGLGYASAFEISLWKSSALSLAFLLLTTACLALILFTGLWILAQFQRDPSFVDAFWAFGICMMALASFALAEGWAWRQVVITVLTLAWGGRLGVHLFRRWRLEGQDRRYGKLLADVREKRGWSFARTTAVFVFGPQAVLMWLTSLPAQLGQVGLEPSSFGLIAYLGMGLAVFGIAYESTADAQLARFKADPDNAGKVLETGLWAWSRHPNYFGEICTWWGIWLIATETVTGLFAIVGPVFLTFTLMRWSGAPLQEPHLTQTRPGYELYKARTSAIFPRPPAKSHSR